jgi:hypothetical protein
MNEWMNGWTEDGQGRGRWFMEELEGKFDGDGRYYKEGEGKTGQIMY